jgi:branched-subunit amino acid transport protein
MVKTIGANGFTSLQINIPNKMKQFLNFAPFCILTTGFVKHYLKLEYRNALLPALTLPL